MKRVEVELKFPLLNHEALAGKLDVVAKREKQGELQKDSYYTPEHRDFIAEKPVREWLRVRESENNCSLTYKNWHKEKNRNTVSCDEFETRVSDAEALKKILESLDFKRVVFVEKKRSTWKYKEAEIAVDDVAGLGFFIELEATGEFADIQAAEKRLHEILLEIGAETGEQDFEGYAYLLLKKD